MFQKKKQFFCLLLVLICFLAGSHFAVAKEKCKIGYGYATTVMSKENQEHFYLGFQYGLKQGFKDEVVSSGPCRAFEDVEIVELSSQDQATPLEAVKVAEALSDKNVLLLSGFPTSHEALLAARVAQSKKIGFVSLGAVANGLGDYKDYVFSTSPKRQTYSKELIRGWSNRYAGQEILVIAKKDFVFSMDSIKSLNEENQKSGSVKLMPIFVNDNLTINQDMLSKVDLSKINAVYITLYSADSRLIFLELIRVLNPKATIYVASSWVSHRVDFFDEVSEEAKKRVVAFGAGVPRYHDAALSELRKLYEETFKQTPATEVFEGYEGGVFVSHLLMSLKQNTREAALTALQNLTCVPVWTRDKLCRTPEGYSDKKLYFYQWTPAGYVLEEI